MATMQGLLKVFRSTLEYFRAHLSLMSGEFCIIYYRVDSSICALSEQGIKREIYVLEAKEV